MVNWIGMEDQMTDMVFVDTEVSAKSEKLMDIGAIRATLPVTAIKGREYHDADQRHFAAFAKGASFLCGHNLIEHDAVYLLPAIRETGILRFVDTLPLSPLLFPRKPYHHLVKDYKLVSEEMNNPLCDAKNCMSLFLDEVAAFRKLPDTMQSIYHGLLSKEEAFKSFFDCLLLWDDAKELDLSETDLIEKIYGTFQGKICENVHFEELVRKYKIETAYVLAAISADDRESVLPGWVMKNYPKVTEVTRLLRGTPCKEGCAYCDVNLNIHRKLKEKFGYENFRTYNGAKLQEEAVRAAVDHKSLIAIFPTGGGKSLTFQLPALIAAETEKGLTVVISPLQSLMKDQVDNLTARGIPDAVTINGLLNVLERKEAIERVASGIASILYIAPESLRSRSVEKLLSSRNVVRFVIDEAHCFSSWGQDFRVDYLYIGDFIAALEKKLRRKIPVSCFTATAKQKVISDIREYFKRKLDVELEMYTTDAARTNLRYEVRYQADRTEKYRTLRSLIQQKNCPTIVYTSRTKRTEELADRLQKDGISALPYHGKMDQEEKVKNQDAFLSGEVQIIVATSAFGMGVDKPDVKLVIHYDISDSLENYVQEAGRAGRDTEIDAECYILFNEKDLDAHFTLLNQTKLTMNEIQQIWRGIKMLSGRNERIFCSALDLAKSAGWTTNTVTDLETKVRTAVTALEMAGYIERGNNSPRIYADSILVKNIGEAREKMDFSGFFTEESRERAVFLLQTVLSSRSRDRKDPVTYVDYLADTLGYEKEEVIRLIDQLKCARILSDDKEMTAFLTEQDIRRKGANRILSEYLQLERFVLTKVIRDQKRYGYKELNEEALAEGIPTDVKRLKEIVHFWTIRGYIEKPEGEVGQGFTPCLSQRPAKLLERLALRETLCTFIDEAFVSEAAVRAASVGETGKNVFKVDFSSVDLLRKYNAAPVLYERPDAEIAEVEEALLYISRTKAFRIEGGFLMMYNRMEIRRKEKDNRIQYKKDDYKKLEEFYHLKTQQIHIVGEYANMIVRDYTAALTFVHDYFQMDYQLFLKKYFQGSRKMEIERNISPGKYHELFEELTERQAEVINDDESKVIVVAAGPGSGKTKILVHKLASLVLMEDVKYEQLLMLTFSRAAATEFKTRLRHLIAGAANFVEIKTFHSYAFDLLGTVGSIEKSKTVVADATRLLREGVVEEERITKTVLVLDEAQDINQDEYEMIMTLREKNEGMRIIAVGDDDQNIYSFRGSSSGYMRELGKEDGAKVYELVENFRSAGEVVGISNVFLGTLKDRLKMEEIRAARDLRGRVAFIRYEREDGLCQEVEMIFEQWYRKDKSTAILTTTNDQSYLIYYLLYQKGLRPRLIQEAEGFPPEDMDEFRYFFNVLRKSGEVRITDEMWENAKVLLAAHFQKSEVLPQVLYTLDKFRESSPEGFVNDLSEFLREAKLSDFYRCDTGEICISTIHKAKGHEYEDVFLVVSETAGDNQEKNRAIYVGMTRAKECLYVITDHPAFGSLLGTFKEAGADVYKDATEFSPPKEIMMALSLKDIWLEFNGNTGGIHSGMPLIPVLQEEKLFFTDMQGKKVACASMKFLERMEAQRKKGYQPEKAVVNFVVWWKKDDEERRVVLPRLVLKRDLSGDTGLDQKD